MKSFSIFGTIFGLIGIIMLILCVYFIFDTKEFIKISKITKGTIVDFYESESKDSDGYVTISYFPIVEYFDDNGDLYDYKSSSNTTDLTTGRIVDVRYNPADPRDARIASDFSDMWAGSLVTGIIGVVFTFLGTLFYFIGTSEKRRAKKALSYTKIIEARISGVELNTSIRVNGAHPFRLLAEWKDDRTNEIYEFKSSNLWFNPEPYIDREFVTIKADPHNIKKKNWMDISFLPKKA
ncbi:MAG: DUF3592 domain-containing protein [Candidatus Delongbacteria bacterium]|nr:DUF3592 domain-containing protein [Candidatus Delongbacteria bacterium]